MKLGTRDKAVAISGNGAVVAMDVETRSRSSGNEVHIYNNSCSIWTKTHILRSPNRDATEDFGSSIAMNYEGTMLIIGAPNLSTHGAVYIYALQPTGYVLERVITGWSIGDNFGYSVDMNSRGDVVAVGAPGTLLDDIRIGRCYIYDRTIEEATDSPIWSPKALMGIDNRTNNNSFGTSVSMDAAGETVVVGSPADAIDGSEYGAAYIYDIDKYSKGSTLISKLMLSNGDQLDNETYGINVCISGGGYIAAISSISGTGDVTIHTYEKNNKRWTHIDNVKSNVKNSSEHVSTRTMLDHTGATMLLSKSRLFITVMEDKHKVPDIPYDCIHSITKYKRVSKMTKTYIGTDLKFEDKWVAVNERTIGDIKPCGTHAVPIAADDNFRHIVVGASCDKDNNAPQFLINYD